MIFNLLITGIVADFRVFVTITLAFAYFSGITI
jgi:hypothetical protein